MRRGAYITKEFKLASNIVALEEKSDRDKKRHLQYKNNFVRDSKNPNYYLLKKDVANRYGIEPYRIDKKKWSQLPPSDRENVVQDVPSLSEKERSQLGKPKGTKVRPTEEEWKEVRDFMWNRSKKRSPSLTKDMTAYTPGETLDLMNNPKVKDWHDKMRDYKIPDDKDLVVFVPCAATKPWDDAKRGIYKSYNMIRDDIDKGKLPNAYFVTISEPLGVVPEDHWGDFPMYDNPGLFKDDFMRSGGIYKKQWMEEFGKGMATPFDDDAYNESIDKLSGVIGDFAKNNKKEGRRFISFVDNPDSLSTHRDMLNRANEENNFIDSDDMFQKRAESRKPPYDFLKEKIKDVAESGVVGDLRNRIEKKL